MPGKNHFFGRDIVSIRDFSRDDLEFIFDSTDKI
jgi:aspartate carbamoyltransferase catalytic subunit